MADIKGTNGRDELFGTRLNDTIDGLGGADTLHGGKGNDYVVGGFRFGNDLLLGEEGNDTLSGGFGSDTLLGGEGEDRLVLDLGPGADFLDGGDGVDELFIVAQVGYKEDIVVSVDDPDVEQTLANGTRFIHLERLKFVGGRGDDQVTGGDKSDTLTGGGGDDTLEGGGGVDTLIGGTGGDVLIAGDTPRNDGMSVLTGGEGDDHLFLGANGDSGNGGDGNDTVIGGAGNDLLFDLGDFSGTDLVAGRGGADVVRVDTLAGDTISGGGGTDFLQLTIFDSAEEGLVLSAATPKVAAMLADGTRIVGFERLDLVGGLGADSVTGGALADRLAGYEGDDTLSGGGGADALAGGAGSDVMDGGAGRDVLIFGAGADTMTGGAGADTFRLDPIDPSFVGQDVILDFSSAEGDVIDLRSLTSKGFFVTYIGSDRFSGDSAELRVIRNEDGFLAQIDLDRDQRADMSIEIQSDVRPTESDFIL